MINKVTAKRAREILTAFLGSDIELLERGKGKTRNVVVSTTTLTPSNRLASTEIMSRPTWHDLLIDLLPSELVQDKANPPFNEIGYVSSVYQFRHIGKAIKRDSRRRLFTDNQ